jgi:DNA-binding MarR family transcriptional regulator
MTAPSPDECAKMGVSCACFNLRSAARAVTQLFDTFFGEVGLKTTQFIVLAAVQSASRGEPNAGPTVSSLADSLVLEQSSLSRNLAVLERLGYIRLVPGLDRRERLVTLTRAGRAILARGFPLWQRAQTAVARTFEPGAFESHLQSLRHVTRASRAALDAPPSRFPRQVRPVANRREPAARSAGDGSRNMTRTASRASRAR